MATEVLDIVVRQRGARVVARDIAKIGIAADTSARSLRTLQNGLKSAQGALQRVQATTAAASTNMKAFGGAAAGAKRSLTALGTGVALIGGAITAALIRPLAGAVRAAGDFQAAMNLTGVLANVERTGESFKALEDKAKSLGITTVFSAVQAAEGMQFLAKAGFEANEILAAIEPTTNLAAAANIDLARAADIATNILRGFQQTTDQLPAAIDTLTSAFTSSNTNIEELGKTFAAVGPIAVKAGQQFKDVAAVTSALADAGIKGQKAGIALRRIFINLQTDSAKLSPILSRIGVSLFEVGEDGVKKLRPLDKIFKDIANSSATTQDKIRLFGARAIAAAGIIEDSAPSLEKFADRIGSDVGRAAEVAEARLLGFNGAMLELRSALEGLGIAIAEAGLLDFLEFVTDKVKGAVRAFTQLPKPIRAFIGFGAAAAAVLAILTLKIGLLIIAISVLSGSGGFLGLVGVLGKVGTALKTVSLFFVTNPIGLMVTALAALGVALFLARDKLIEFGDSQFRVKDLVSAAWDDITERFEEGGTAAENAVKKSKDAIKELEEAEKKSTFGDVFITGFLLIQAASITALRFIGSQFDIFIETLKRKLGFFSRVFEAFQTGGIVAAFVEAGKDSGDGFVTALGKGLGELPDIFAEEILSSLEVLGDAEKKFLAERDKNLPKGGTLPPPGTPKGKELPIPISEGELKRRQNALNALTASLNTATEVEKKLFAAETALNDARRVGAGLISEQTEEFIRQRQATLIFEELERAIDPVAAAMFEEERALRDVDAAAKAAGISGERLARTQELVKEKFRDARLEIKEFQEQLGTGEAITEGLRKGFEDFNDSLGTMFSNIREVTANTLDGMLDEVNNFITTGEADFRGFALSVIAEIQKIILKLFVLQSIRAFEQTIEQGKGVGEFAKAFFGPRLKATEPGAAQAGAPAPGAPAPGGVTTATGFQLQGPQFGGGAAAAIAEQVPGKSPGDPVHSSITADSPGLTTLNENLGLKLDQSKTATVEQLVQLNSSVTNLTSQLAAGAAGPGGVGAGRTDPVTGALEGVAATTGQGLVENKAEVQRQGGIVDKTTSQGFKDNIGTAINVGGNIVRALTSGSKGDQGAAIGSILGAIAGGIIGGPAGAQIGASLGGQAGGIAGSLQSGGAITGAGVNRPFLVGERGPELFMPPTTGMVVPNDALGRMGAPPEVNVQVINIDDAKAIPEAISTREGENAVMNIITRNKGRLREIIA